VFTVFATYSLSYSLSLPSPHLLQVPIPCSTQDLFHLPILQFCRRKKKNEIFACLR
jgi:hypothetical protein